MHGNDEDLILDTETTGLGSDAEIVEASLIGAISGEVYLDTLIRPLAPIPPDATEIHGITDQDVESAPTWSEVYHQFCELVTGRTVHIYNSSYDVRLVNQTSDLYGLDRPVFETRCVMHRYANLWREEKDYGRGWRWQSLTNAVAQQGIDVSELEAHRARSDCEMTRRLLKRIEADAIEPSPEWVEEQRYRDQRDKRRAYYSEKMDFIKSKLLPPGVKIVEDKKGRAVVDDSGKEWTYFGQGCPFGMTTLSKLNKSDVERYQFAGMCVSTYGDWGYVVKPI